jgi:hypothetical protein
MTPNYLATFRRAVRQLEGGEKSEISEKSTPHISLSSLISRPFSSGTQPFAEALSELGRQCPDHVEAERWRQCVADAQRFLASWSDNAAALGWRVEELFGLHPVPVRPAPSYCRLARYDCIGLLWLLRGRPVVALTHTTAAIATANGTVVYRKLNKPALGPLGDSLDDFNGGDPPEVA